jgi:hypothetical protein
MKKLTRWLTWLDDNILKVLLAGFIFVAPLYPKLPIRMINFTYIAIRAEDFYIAFLYLVFIIQLIRRKTALNTKFLILFVLFWISATASFVYGYYYLQTIDFGHLGILHTLRRIEYMGVFFVAASIVRNKKEFWHFIKLVLIALLVVLVYGVGQKFLGWPAVQTMNPEYAKGYLLYLTPEARVSSTFAGHYDLAAYLVLLIPILLGAYFYRKHLSFLGLFILSIFLIVLTAARSSYVAYIVATAAYLILMKKPKILLLAIVFTFALTFVDKTLSSRISRTFQVKQIFVNQETGQVVIPQKITVKELPAGSFYIKRTTSKKTSATVPTPSIVPVATKTAMTKPLTKPPSATTSLAKPGLNLAYLTDFVKKNLTTLKQKVYEALKLNVLLGNKQTDPEAGRALLEEKLREDIRDDAKKSGKKLTVAEEEAMIATISASLQPVTTVVSDISFATRLQVEWPRAINAFARSPILGWGPSSITEATDNDYLRWLGEFGALGTILFLSIIIGMVIYILLSMKLVQKERRVLYYGFIFGLFALLINATYIDVFEASKVAYIFWTIAGIYIGSLSPLKEVFEDEK